MVGACDGGDPAAPSYVEEATALRRTQGILVKAEIGGFSSTSGFVGSPRRKGSYRLSDGAWSVTTTLRMLQGPVTATVLHVGGATFEQFDRGPRGASPFDRCWLRRPPGWSPDGTGPDGLPAEIGALLGARPAGAEITISLGGAAAVADLTEDVSEEQRARVPIDVEVGPTGSVAWRVGMFAITDVDRGLDPTRARGSTAPPLAGPSDLVEAPGCRSNDPGGTPRPELRPQTKRSNDPGHPEQPA